MPNSQPLTTPEQFHSIIPASLRRYVDDAGRVVLWPAKKMPGYKFWPTWLRCLS